MKFKSDIEVQAGLKDSSGSVGTSGKILSSTVSGVSWIDPLPGGVTSFNTRTGVVTLTSGDVVNALGYTPVTQARTLTINGTTYDLSANRSWTVTGGIGGSGTATYLPKFTAATTLADSQLIDNGTYLSIGNPTNTRIKWGGTTTPTLGFPFSPTNALWLEVNDGDTGGIAIDNDGVTVYGAGDNGYVFRVIDEDVYQSTSNLFASTTFQVNQGQNGGGYIKGNFDISGYVTIGGSAYLASGNFLYFDSGVTNDYSIKKNGTALQFDSGGDFTFNKGVNILTTRDNALVLRAMDGGTSPWNYIEYLNSAGTRKYYVGTDTSNVFNIYSDDGTGYVYSNTSFRSPIFYDVNDTAYYGDFASTSNFRNLLLNNQTSFNTSTPGLTSYGLTFMGGTADYANGMTWTWGNTNAQAGIYVQSSGAYGTKMYFATTDSFATGAKTAMHIDHNGTVSVNRSYLQSDSSLRAPVFYDSNDTTYYTDLASTSQTATRQRGGTVYGPNTTWGAYLLVGGNGRTGYIDNALTASVCATDGNIHIDAGSAKSTYFNWYDGSSIIFGNGAEAQIGTMNSSGDLTVNSSSRAPIFYDSNNTGYYLDPNSTSNLYSATFAGLVQVAGTGGNYNEGIRLTSGTGSWSNIQFGANTSGAGTQANQWIVGKRPDGLFVMSLAGNQDGGSRFLIQQDGRVQSPVYYDGNNTNFYLDLDGTSEINKVYYNSNMVSRNYGIGQIGVYASTRYQAVFSMGESYVLPADGTTAGNLYGLTWSHPNAGGVAGNLNTHGLLALENGTWLASLTGSTRARDDMRAPIFYDNNNTGYYVDPASTSNINAITIGSASTAYNGLSIVRSGGGSDPYGVFGVSCPSGDNYAYIGLTRNGVIGMAMGIDTNNNFWIGSSGGGHNSVRTSTYMTLSSGGVLQTQGYIYSSTYVQAGNQMYSPIYYDANDTAYYLDPASTSNLKFLQVGRPSNGQSGTKLLGGQGTSYGAITLDVEVSNYGTGIKINNQSSTYASSAMQFFWNGTQCGSVGIGPGFTSYNTSSDYRLKENISPMVSSIERVKELNPCRFNFINSPDRIVDGFIAHEVQAVIPEAITGEKDELNYDGTPKYQGIDQSKMVPLLTAALQEAISKIEELENRLSILENK